MGDSGAASNQKASPRVHWNKGKLNANNQGPISRDETVIRKYLENHDRLTDDGPIDQQMAMRAPRKLMLPFQYGMVLSYIIRSWLGPTT